MPFKFEIGKEYETQDGKMVKVLGRTKIPGYECLECSDGKYRYDRSYNSSDAGRCTGTEHDYSCPHNFKRDDLPKKEEKFVHIDDWIDSPSKGRTREESYAKWIFWYFRYPAWAQIQFHEFMKDYLLFCTYKGKRYRVTGASRMGDIWLTEDPNRDTGYELRVGVNECSGWGNQHEKEGLKEKGEASAVQG